MRRGKIKTQELETFTEYICAVNSNTKFTWEDVSGNGWGFLDYTF